MTTILLYLYDERGVYTETREHPVKAPLPPRWTKTPPPNTQEGEYSVWERNQWSIFTEGPPFPEPVIPVPEVVSRFQALAALYLAGLLERVEEVMQDPTTPILARMAWQNALFFERNSQTVAAIASVLGLSDVQVDELFISAAGIQA